MGLAIEIIRVPRWVPMDDVLLEVFWAEGQVGLGQWAGLMKNISQFITYF